MPRLYALILSGGAGTRLWPLSRKDRPKQFLELLDGRSLLQDTVERVSGFIPTERIFVVAPPEHRALVHAQLPELAVDHLVIEPYPRGNAAAVGLAMAALAAFDPEAVVAVLPSDHVVERRDAFRTVLVAATAAAESGRIATIGIRPTAPDTGFGYIEAGAELPLGAPLPVHEVRRFVEKPPLAEAARMVASGGHYWNAGMFVWRVDTVLEAYRRHLPKTAAAIEAVTRAHGSLRYAQELAEIWETTDQTTLDYGIAEKAANVAVVPADIGWHDVGSWARLAAVVGDTAGGRAGEHIAEDARGNFVWAPGKVVVTVGVDHLVVVDTPDVLLVVGLDRSEDVRRAVDRLKREGRDDLL